MDILLNVKNENVISDLLFAYSHLIENSGKTAGYTIKQINIPKIIGFLKSKNENIQISTIRVIGNLCAGEIKNLDRIIENGALQKLQEILYENDNPKIIRELCWAFSNIAAGTDKHIRMLMDQGVIKKLIEFIQKTQHYPIKREAGWTIINSIKCKDDAILDSLIYDYEILSALACLLIENDMDLTYSSLFQIKKILQNTTNLPKYIEMLEKNGFSKKLVQLQLVTNIRVYKLVEEMLNKYVFDEKEENIGNIENNAMQEN